MVDRQDIDALLIGSLYGELSSAEEARLAAHLESHPADRTALADLTRAREVVRESRILQVQFDPPQSISALLMQEAARRAPKPRDEQSWFQRFMRSFMAHPAMAAAAMLVLIIGVAGTVYMRQGDHFANQTKDDTASPAAPAMMPPAAGEPADHLAAGSASSDNYQVQLDDRSLRKELEERGEARAQVAAAEEDRAREVAQKIAADEIAANQPVDLAFEAKKNKVGSRNDTADGYAPAKPASKPPAVAKAPRRLEVTTPSPGPKDLDSTTLSMRDEATKKGDATGATSGATRGAGGAPLADPVPGNARPAPAPPPPPAEREKQKQEQADPQLAWAKAQHGKVIAAVKAGNCQTAANLAVQISNRAPAYYASNIETDRTLKQCMQYITAQREKEAERLQRSKATQRRAVDEAPAPTSTK